MEEGPTAFDIPCSVKTKLLFKKRQLVFKESGDILAFKVDKIGTRRPKEVLRHTSLVSAVECSSHGSSCTLITTATGVMHLQASAEDAKRIRAHFAKVIVRNSAMVNSHTYTNMVAEGGVAAMLSQKKAGSGVVGGGGGKEESVVQVARGYVPKYPVVLIPGLASSALDCVKSLQPGYDSRRLWIGLGSLASGRMFTKEGPKIQLSSRDGAAPTEADDLADFLGGAAGAGGGTFKEAEADARSNLWIRHMTLNESRDGWSDPPGVVVRAVPGVKGCAYLSKEKLTSPLSYVFGFVVDMLNAAGYVEGQNLHAATYDWRCAITKLEAKYEYFSTLKKDVEKLVKQNNGTPTVLLAHSMGNRVVQYFLRWVEMSPSGQAWIDQHVAGFLACGAPWLGAPKILRSLATGNRMDLDLFLSESEGHELLRCCGSLPGLLPLRCQDESVLWRFPWKERKFVVMRNGKYLSEEEVLQLGRLESTAEMVKTLYKEDKVWNRALQERPPVKQIWNVIGTNLETEMCYAFIEESQGFVLNRDPEMERFIQTPGFHFANGIYSESGKWGSSGQGSTLSFNFFFFSPINQPCRETRRCLLCH